ncbi:hypothetical protein QBC42DRAFT_333136 [Cladorrhinum samala]|uniref:F-box domain-containing protein n=1 Tax=Cladorrhinum samala TaxID=585594 RepID=A0AAV9I126_9PEZI|nr:hypothetical protein QBC42DRAFT_333136 [Cladorrhinum samala]
MSSQTPIDTLPNELLIDILSPFSTADILPLLPISRHFHSVILRILRQRLTRATSLPDHRLILEAYHPSAKLSTPYLYCDYLYTDKTLHGKEQEEQTGGSDGGTLQSLSQTYSHFRPVVQEENQRARARYRSRLLAQQSSSGDGEGGGGDAKPPPEWQLETIPSHEVFLDEDEMFSQLCTVTNLVKTGPKPGLFLSHVNVSDGLIRIKRDWLAARARKGGDSDDEDAILWADAARTVGVRFRVREMDTGIERPVLVAEGEEIAVSYRLEYVELLVRTSRLLMMVEKSEGQEIDPQGGAVVIAAV